LRSTAVSEHEKDIREVIQLEAIINEYISRELVQDPSLLPLGNAMSLLETGVLDSLSLLRLVVFVQERFGVTVDDVDLVPENFDTVNAICAYLLSRTGEGAGQAGSRG
jgi:acyl carrier protein